MYGLVGIDMYESEDVQGITYISHSFVHCGLAVCTGYKHEPSLLVVEDAAVVER